MSESANYIEVTKPGLLDSIQDLGRYGHADKGVPVSGAMDRRSHKRANKMVGNPADSATIEITAQGGHYRFHLEEKAMVGFAGAKAAIALNNKPVETVKAIEVNDNDRLSIGPVTNGVRLYMAVSGGLDTQKVLGSRSWFSGITGKSRLTKGDKLKIATNPNSKIDHSGKSTDLQGKSITAYPGPEHDYLSQTQKRALVDFDFHISREQNRMGITLKEKLKNDNLPELLSSPTLPGTVQLTPAGKLVILMRDAQVTGGYPRILQLIDHSVDRIAQKRTGEAFRWDIIEGTVL